ncbi:unnamed protein product [Victoria cruziana]
MEGKRVVFLLITVTIFAASEAARTDLPSILGVGNGFHEETEADCCDECVCSESSPAECVCDDIKNYCPPSCVRCGCTKSIPPLCFCRDVNPSFCTTPCAPKIR